MFLDGYSFQFKGKNSKWELHLFCFLRTKAHTKTLPVIILATSLGTYGTLLANPNI